MMYKKIENAQGNYIDKKQVRFDILEAHEAWTPDGLNVGWDEYDSIEAAAIAYGLTLSPLPEPIESEEVAQ